MGNYTYAACKQDYTNHWADLEINPNKQIQFQHAAAKIQSGAAMYQKLEAQTGIPWYFIGLLHYRESDCNFHTHLHNGDSLNARTHNVPAGRPRTGTPPFSFEFSAIDALADYKGQDWSTDTIEKISYNSEKFNGFGYRMHGVPSAYLYAGTNQYSHGKYVSDGVWSSNTVDSQLGCMGILKTLLASNAVAITPKAVEVANTAADEPFDTPKAHIERPTDKEMNSVSRKHFWSDWGQKIAGLFGAGGVAYKAADSSGVEAIQPAVWQAKQIATAIGVSGIIVVAIGLVIWFGYLKKLQKDDVVEGRATPSGSDSTNITTAP